MILIYDLTFYFKIQLIKKTSFQGIKLHQQFEIIEYSWYHYMFLLIFQFISFKDWLQVSSLTFYFSNKICSSI